MSAGERDPFEILGISPDSELAAVEMAYRAKALRVHPDVAGPAGTEEMKALNWARDELRADLDGWRERVVAVRMSRQVARSAPREQRDIEGDFVPSVFLEWVEVTPQVLYLEAIQGRTVMFRARCRGSATNIRARVRRDVPLALARTSESAGLVAFSVTVTEPRYTGADADVYEIELTAQGHFSNRVFVVVTPITEAIVNQRYSSERIAPARVASPQQRLGFGRHKGRTYAQVALENPGWLEWMIRVEAGSVIERDCARMALGLRASTPTQVELRGDRRPKAPQIPRSSPTATQTRPVPQLPQRTESSGVMAKVKRLLLRSPKD